MKDFKELVGYMGPMTGPAFVVGLILALGSLKYSGIESAARDIYAAAVYVHPFLFALGGLVITSYFAVQDATVSRRVRNWFLLPILSFTTQLFSGAVGVFFPLHFALKPGMDCENIVSAGATFVVLLAVSVAASATQVLVLRRARAIRERVLGANGRDGEATENQAMLFLVLAVACLGFAVASAPLTQTSEQLITHGQLKASGWICY